MIRQEKIREIRRMLAEGTASQRGIARQTGVSRATISAIATGKYVYRPRTPAVVENYSLTELGPVARCPGCGGKVYLPCRLCRVRELKSRERGHPVHRSARRRRRPAFHRQARAS